MLAPSFVAFLQMRTGIAIFAAFLPLCELFADGRRFLEPCKRIALASIWHQRIEQVMVFSEQAAVLATQIHFAAFALRQTSRIQL